MEPEEALDINKRDDPADTWSVVRIIKILTQLTDKSGLQFQL
jgi:hypothetical protein